MFDRFTEKAIKVVMLSQEEARRFRWDFVGAEQLLLGVLAEGSGTGARVLKKKGITLKKARMAIENDIGFGYGSMEVDIPFTARAKKVLANSIDESLNLGHPYIGTEHILLGVLRETNGVLPRIFNILKMDCPELRSAIIRDLEEDPLNEYSTKKNSFKDSFQNWWFGGEEISDSAALTICTNNISAKASKGRIDPVIGRDVEVQRVVQTLGRRRKNNPALLGEPGVGKTAIAEGLALRILNKKVPEVLYDRKVLALDVGLLLAGTRYRGEFELRLTGVMREVSRAKNIILVIDEVHTLVGAGATLGAMDAANILKPALARGDFQCIGATTISEYRRYIEEDPALERRFQPVIVPEPSVEETIQILFGLRERYEGFHKLKISDGAIRAAATLSDQYIADRFLPDKAIDLIDEASARISLLDSMEFQNSKQRELEKQLRSTVALKEKFIREQNFEGAEKLQKEERLARALAGADTYNKRIVGDPSKESSVKVLSDGQMIEEATIWEVTAGDVSQIVAAWSGVPTPDVTGSEAKKLLEMEDTLHGRVIGQDRAISAVARALRRSKSGIRAEGRPIGNFMFCGPTGVGKTELAKVIASYFFGSEEAMARFDMSEYMERHTISRLIGTPPGYLGYEDAGQLTDAIRQRPYTVVLFDEIEKAHPNIYALMLQIFEDGQLTDSRGRVAYFQNTLVILTSNAGSNSIDKNNNKSTLQVYSDPDDEFNERVVEANYDIIKSNVIEALQDIFRPELLNRVDEIIVFRQLTKGEVGQIADIMLNDLNQRMGSKGIYVHPTEKTIQKVINDGYDPMYGARPVRRAIAKNIEDQLTIKVLDDDN